MIPWGLERVFFAGVEVVVRPAFLRRSNEAVHVEYGPLRPVLMVWSLNALHQGMRGVEWHDDAEHCRTWADGCRCDLGEGA